MASNLSARVRRLEDSAALLDEMIHRLQHLQPTMQGLVHSLAMQERFRKIVFLEDCRKRMLEGENFPQSWKCAARTQAGALGGEEAELIASLGDVLGRTDLESQLGALRCAVRLLEERISGARHLAGQRSGLYRAMGVLCGIAIVILLV